MEKFKSYEEFEVDDNEKTHEGDENKKHKNYSFIKLLFLLFLILLISFCYFFFTGLRLKEKKNEIKKIQTQKQLLEEGTKKLVTVLATVDDTFDLLDKQIEEIKKVNQEKKVELINYQETINVNNSLILGNVTQERDKQKKILSTLKEINQAHLKEVKILRNEFRKQCKEEGKEEKTKNEIGTNIFDTDSEISLIKSWIDKQGFNKINLKLCYRGSDSLFNPTTAYNQCDLLNKNKEFLIIYQTECFGRFGIFYGNQNHNDLSFVFEMEQKMRYLVPKDLIRVDVVKMNFPTFYFNDDDDNKDIYPYTIKVNRMLKNVGEDDVNPYDFWVFGSFKVVEKNMPKMTDISEIEIFHLD